MNVGSGLYNIQSSNKSTLLSKKIIPIASSHFFDNNVCKIIVPSIKFSEYENTYIQKKDLECKFIKIKYAPSDVLPLTDGIDLIEWNKICSFYGMENFELTDRFSEKCILDTDMTGIINSITEYVNKLIDKDNGFIQKNYTENTQNKKQNIEKLNKILHNKTTADKFLNEYRLCTNYIHQVINTDTINSIKVSVDENIDNFSDYICNNMVNFIIKMEKNIINKLLTKIDGNTKCWNIQEILNWLKSIVYFNNLLIKGDFYYFELLFLLQNDYFFKKSQIDKYREILDDIPNKELKLHQFMMGKGKTSVITPLLSFAIKFLKKGYTPVIITADHLVKQTIKYIEFINNMLSGDKIKVRNDYEAKEKWIEITNEKKEHLKNEYNIIDEFDLHYNYLQSMFNSVIKSKNINNIIIEYVYNFVKDNGNFIDDKVIIDNTVIPNMIVFKHNLKQFYEEANKMTYKQHYGFEFLHSNDKIIQNQKHRLCVPFSRKDTPIKNSYFSSILLTLILTFKIYIKQFNENKSLFEQDYINIKNDLNILAEILNENLDDTDMDIKKIKSEINKVDNIVYKYLLVVNTKQNKFIYTTSQYNISFQDIIHDIYGQWQTGYTGTATLSLTDKYDKNSEEKYRFNKIIYDYDEMIEINLAFMGYSCPTDYDDNVRIIDIDKSNNNTQQSITNIFNIPDIQGLTGFIDTIGLFVNDSNKDIAHHIQEKIKSKKIVYFSDNHEALQYDSNEIINYTENDENNFYYYDQCHLVGSDLKQHNIGHVLILFDKTTRMTEFEQALFRFRKINRGTYMSLIYIRYNNDNDDDEKYINVYKGDDENLDEVSDNKNDLRIKRKITLNDIANIADIAKHKKTLYDRCKKYDEKNYENIKIVSNSLKSDNYLTNEMVYNLLMNNEIKFNINQRTGIKYQFLKTLVKKNTKVYKEDNLEPEFLRNELFTDENIIDYINHNILPNMPKSDLSINKLYNYLNINKKFLAFITGYKRSIEHSKAIEKESSLEKAKESSLEQEDNKQFLKVRLSEYQNIFDVIKKHLSNYTNLRCILHRNCKECLKINGVKLFRDNGIYMINDLEVYISYNILSFFQGLRDISISLLDTNPNSAFSNDLYNIWNFRICFIMLETAVLIEREAIGLDYYIFKYPVYNNLGKLLYPYLNNSNGKQINKLNIDPHIVTMLGMIEYTRPVETFKKEIKIEDCVNNLSADGIIFVAILICFY